MELEYCILDLLMINKEQISNRLQNLFRNKNAEIKSEQAQQRVKKTKKEDPQIAVRQSKKTKYDFLAANALILQNYHAERTSMKIEAEKEKEKNQYQNQYQRDTYEIKSLCQIANLKLNLSKAINFSTLGFDPIFQYAHEFCDYWTTFNLSCTLDNFDHVYFRSQPEMTNIFILTTQILAGMDYPIIELDTP